MITEDGKVVFDETEQAEVDRIIGERLARVKAETKLPEDYEDLKEIAQELEGYGYQGTAAEKKAAIKAQRAEQAKQKEIEDLQEQAEQTGTSPEILAELKTLKAELSSLKDKEKEREEKKLQKQQEEETKTKQDEKVKAEIVELQEKYTEVDINVLAKDEDFIDFVANSSPNLTLVQKYEKYLKLITKAEGSAVNKIKSNIDRSTNNGKSKGIVGETHGLTARQQALAEENGLSYKEYASMMSLIKK